MSQSSSPLSSMQSSPPLGGNNLPLTAAESAKIALEIAKNDVLAKKQVVQSFNGMGQKQKGNTKDCNNQGENPANREAAKSALELAEHAYEQALQNYESLSQVANEADVASDIPTISKTPVEGMHIEEQKDQEAPPAGSTTNLDVAQDTVMEREIIDKQFDTNPGSKTISTQPPAKDQGVAAVEDMGAMVVDVKEEGEQVLLKDDLELPDNDLDNMLLDEEGFIASKLRPSKKHLSALHQEEAQLTRQIEKMEACLTDASLNHAVKEAVSEAIKVSIAKRVEVQADIQIALAGKPKASRKSDNKNKEKKASGDGKKEHDILVRWAGLTAKEKEDYRVGRQAIQDYLKDQESISYDLRRLMKLLPDFLPECAYISRDLALHVFDNRVGNNACILHTFKTAGFKDIRDGSGKYLVNGVPFPKETKEANGVLSALACGCWIDEALLDFIFFKCATAISHNRELPARETLGNEPLGTRHRTFLAQAFKETGLTVNDFYVGDGVFGSPTHVLDLVIKVLRKVSEELPAGTDMGNELIQAMARAQGQAS
ncbi:hypothetical protein R3P38DRAFT_3170586 [Favolaschia claudopus]|uniref:Uncharacterized protein n=1 Tax=Favolaschia claudopus TaxID=2862362 RepID=A0AAW0DWH5_9AGAR